MPKRRKYNWGIGGSKKVKTRTMSWYKFEGLSGIFYTPFPGTKRSYKYIGDGNSHPTPKQIVEALSNSDGWLLEGAPIISENLPNETNMEEVDIPCGTYVYSDEDGSTPERLVPFELREDTYLALNSIEDQIQKDIDSFLNNEKLYRDHGLIYKLGQLLYGIPGCGKTQLIRQILHRLKEKDVIAIFIEKDFPSEEFMIKIKDTLGGRLKVFVFEELAVDLSEWFIGKLLTFLDGELSIDRSITLATTNYPEKIPGNLANRPSRFDKLYELGTPKVEERKLLFKHFLGRDITDKEAEASKDLSIADIKEASLNVLMNKVDLSIAIKQLKDRAELVKKAFCKAKQIVGFGSGRYGSTEDD